MHNLDDLLILEEQPTVAQNMERWGGSFIQNIGHALVHADFQNARKIKNTWPEEWDLYLNFTTSNGVKK